MAAREAKTRNERNDTLALLFAGTIIGAFLSLIAGFVPLAVIITAIGSFGVTRLMVKSAL
ncbi:MAG: hypothetical protein P4L46_20015 [Fimbriimonas sp.]|nr:hypothetical protein [Fimbriimonas sp.]